MSKPNGVLSPVLLSIVLFCAISPAVAGESTVVEDRIKTAFLYKFLSYVTWPDSAGQDAGTFNLCVLGGEALSGQLEALSGKAVGDRPIRIERIEAPDRTAGCLVVYVGPDTAEPLETVMSVLKEQPVLTVSDLAEFASKGGIIQFYVADDNVRFDINIDAANHVDLTISSKVLALAKGIKQGS